MDALRYSNYDIVFQEVPGEVTLAINITGCPHRCPGCHSSYLQEYFGELLLENLDGILSKYDGLITCVCFMGGEQNLANLLSALKVAKTHYVKTCVYSGDDSVEPFNDVLEFLDYLKIGPYISGQGGLNSESTNQRFYKVENESLIDCTFMFQG